VHFISEAVPNGRNARDSGGGDSAAGVMMSDEFKPVYP